MATLAIITAVALFVSFFTASEASQRETIRLTRDMGFNLRIIPKETNMDAFWTKGFSQNSIPEDYVYRFTDRKDISYAHVTATLNKIITWGDGEVILTGLAPEIEPAGIKRSAMSFSIKPGTVYLGFDIAKRLNKKKGDAVEIMGKVFTVAKTLSETGSSDDIRIYGHLTDIQEILNMRGRINEIQALHCLCITAYDDDPLIMLRAQLEQVLPEAKVLMNKTIAIARERQRLMLENYFAFILPFVIIACAAWIAAVIMVNVRDRKEEIGLLRALGYGGEKIASLFLGKAVIFGFCGAAIGFIFGTALSLIYGPEIFKITAQTIKPIYGLLWWAILFAVVFAVFSAFIPTMIAVTQDPAQTLRGEQL